jgi:hypothetical protein
VNIGAPWPTLLEAKARVLGMQTKLHQWASADESRRFDDLFNLVHDPAFLTVAWSRVRGNKGARSAGVDGQTARYIEQQRGTAAFLNALRADLKARTFEPVPVRERMIPKPGGKLRRLGIPTTRDRVVQASLKLVLEPIFEADFKPCSYGSRPNRRAQDAIAEIHFLGIRPRNYEWVFEADIAACFDEISHPALMGRIRRRIGDKRVLRLVKAFLKAGIMSVDARPLDAHDDEADIAYSAPAHQAKADDLLGLSRSSVDMPHPGRFEITTPNNEEELASPTSETSPRQSRSSLERPPINASHMASYHGNTRAALNIYDPSRQHSPRQKAQHERRYSFTPRSSSSIAQRLYDGDDLEGDLGYAAAEGQMGNQRKVIVERLEAVKSKNPVFTWC